MQNVDVTDYKSVIKFIKSQMKGGVSFENTMKLLGYVYRGNEDTCDKKQEPKQKDKNKKLFFCGAKKISF